MRYIPSFLQPYLETDAMQRLKGIDMNCGVQLTSFPPFVNRKTVNRYTHSLITALLAWHFTADEKQTLACLFHDIATPVFSHTVDFVNGDYMNQESTEAGIAEILEKDAGIFTQLKKDGIAVGDVCDYHKYPLCDNPSPKLSCDRLSYLLSGMVELGFGNQVEAEQIVADLCVSENEEGEKEICFQSQATAKLFTRRSLQCGIIYSCCFDRFAMDQLSDLIHTALAEKILTYKDLYTSEYKVICRLKDSPLQQAWDRYTDLYGLKLSSDKKHGYRCIRVKKRYVDPYVVEKGRMHQLDPEIQTAIQRFVQDDQSIWISGLYKER